MGTQEKNNDKQTNAEKLKETADPDISRHSYEEMAEVNERERDKKPGSQSNHTKQHNNGRGGGK